MFPKWEPHPFPFGNLCLILIFLASQDPLEVSTSVSESYLADLTGVTLASEDTKDSWYFLWPSQFFHSPMLSKKFQAHSNITFLFWPSQSWLEIIPLVPLLSCDSPSPPVTPPPLPSCQLRRQWFARGWCTVSSSPDQSGVDGWRQSGKLS